MDGEDDLLVGGGLLDVVRELQGRPKLWTTPHCAASVTDYKVFAQNFPARLERSLYFSGTLSGAPTDPTAT
ncbi:hypothetical protein [Streptomyces palmae]|uniref:hypothetical protein n=1 Tax=Streptomyces palmae TaxID=1701085 RepID=UPI001FD7814A|nr:hypothetical protein [Streptomyces palmae]